MGFPLGSSMRMTPTYVPVPDSPIQISAVVEARTLASLTLSFLRRHSRNPIVLFGPLGQSNSKWSASPPTGFSLSLSGLVELPSANGRVREKQSSVAVNFQAIRLGDVAIASAAGETLSELGLRVKAASPFADTRFLGYSNGCVGYIPNTECYPTEAWSPWETYLVPDMLCQAYMLPMHVALTARSGWWIVAPRC